ncbi:MAG TPA: glycosyltransferase [Patescibacteria group bacterium]|nr:glycosyltransferase [Patescibacteria group bacterium]
MNKPLSQKKIHVSIGIPIYKGQKHIAETIRSVLSQDWHNFDVLMSVDNNDTESAKICRTFLSDSRFKLHIHRTRLGWVNNFSYLMKHQTGDYWCYLAQDDLITPSYIRKLVAWAETHPEAAVVYSDIQCFGTNKMRFYQQSVVGKPVDREIDLIRNHLPAVAFRGVVRRNVLLKSGGIRNNNLDSFCCDTTWMATCARFGELHRIPQALYRKRYHSNNTHSTWTKHSPSWLEYAWAVHCRDMFKEAIPVTDTIWEKYSIFNATRYRLLHSPTSWAFIRTPNRSRLQRVLYLVRLIWLLIRSD